MSHSTEKLEVCPYNKAHTILRYRMQTHLHKCRKNYPTNDWGFCTHNATHQLPRTELKYHEENLCPDRHSFQSQYYDLKDTRPAPPIAPIVHIPLPEPEEDWDDGQVNAFDPKKNAAEKSMIRGTHCVPPSERKAFKLEHRRHLQERDEERIANGPVNKTDRNKSESTSEEKHLELESLRLPKELPKGFISFGRGARRPPSDEMSESPGHLGRFSELSIDSDGEDKASVLQGVARDGNPQVVFVGRGRGIGLRATSPENVPSVANAWGKGRPKF